MSQFETIPLSVAHHKNIALDGQNPLLLKVYGAYGSNFDLDWRTEDAFLMESGYVRHTLPRN